MMAKKLKTNIQSDSKRIELMALLRELSDSELQQRLWIRHEDFPNASGIDQVIHFIFDDTNIGIEPESEIGIIFDNAEEARCLNAVAKSLETILDELGDASSAEFLKHPKWPEVMSHASAALKVLESTSFRDNESQRRNT